MKSWNPKNKLSHTQRYNGLKIPIIAITGGIGTGKSTFCDILEAEGYQVLRADHIVKKTYELTSVRNQLNKIAPQTIENEVIDFNALRKIFFQSLNTKQQIEDLIYKNMPDVFTKEFQKKENSPYVFYEIPLLFEKKLEAQFDLIICISLSKQEQVKRIKNRDYSNKDSDEINKILDSQLSLENKENLSHFVILNNKKEDLLEGLQDLKSQFLSKI